MNRTLPVGVNPVTPVTVAVSNAVAPVTSVPLHGSSEAPSKTVVVNDGKALVTTKNSQAAVAAWFPRSPL